MRQPDDGRRRPCTGFRLRRSACCRPMRERLAQRRTAWRRAVLSGSWRRSVAAQWLNQVFVFASGPVGLGQRKLQACSEAATSFALPPPAQQLKLQLSLIRWRGGRVAEGGGLLNRYTV